MGRKISLMLPFEHRDFGRVIDSHSINYNTKSHVHGNLKITKSHLSGKHQTRNFSQNNIKSFGSEIRTYQARLTSIKIIVEIPSHKERSFNGFQERNQVAQNFRVNRALKALT